MSVCVVVCVGWGCTVAYAWRGVAWGTISPPGAHRAARKGDSGEGGQRALNEILSQQGAFCAVVVEAKQPGATRLTGPAWRVCIGW